MLAPESALGLLPSIALSSAQAERILTKTEPVPCGWTKQSLDNFYIAGVNERSESPLEYAPEKPHPGRGARPVMRISCEFGASRVLLIWTDVLSMEAGDVSLTSLGAAMLR